MVVTICKLSNVFRELFILSASLSYTASDIHLQVMEIVSNGATSITLEEISSSSQS